MCRFGHCKQTLIYPVDVNIINTNYVLINYNKLGQCNIYLFLIMRCCATFWQQNKN